MNRKYFEIVQKGTEADIFIYGDIASFKYIENDTTAFSFCEQLKNLDVDNINIHIDSYGGEISEAWAIYNELKNHKAKITTYADGFVASAAIYPFLAGTQRIASNVSAFFLHQVLTEIYGNSDDLRKAADELDILNDVGLNAFANLGIDKDTILEMQKNETWLNAEDALNMGIATKIVNCPKEQKTQNARKNIIDKIIKNDIGENEKPEQEKNENKPINVENSLMKFLNC